jgi:RNA recognition motif-containing protein
MMIWAALQVASCTSTKCFFGNLSFKIDDDSFKAEIEPKIGKIVSISWMTDKETQQFRGSGIIEFSSTEDAGKAALLEGEGFEVIRR